jgi:hypothetical protein
VYRGFESLADFEAEIGLLRAEHDLSGTREPDKPDKPGIPGGPRHADNAVL